MQSVNQTQTEMNKTIDIQLISAPLIELGEQLTLALVWIKQISSSIIKLFLFRTLEIIKSKFKTYR